MKALTHCCNTLKMAVEDENIPVSYLAKFREYGIDILDGGTSVLAFTHCPWCAVKLPESLRDAWFEKLEALGIDAFGNEVPEIFQDDRWFRDAEL